MEKPNDFEKKQLKERLQDIETYQKEHEELEYSEMDKHFGVLSLSGRWNSILIVVALWRFSQRILYWIQRRKNAELWTFR